MTINIPHLIGHRGVKGYAPENTAVSLHMAADMGIKMVEFDVKLTKDGVPILFHDDDLMRVLGREDKIADLTWEELQEVDVGSHLSESFAGEKIPHLEDALCIVLDRGMYCNIEIKPCPGREVETAEAVLDCATRIWPDEGPQPLVSSFKATCLETAMHMAENWPRGYLIDESIEDDPEDEGEYDWQKMVEFLLPTTINCNGNAATDEQIHAYVETGLPVLCYTVNEPMRAQQLFDMGVSAIFSDTPDIIEDEVEFPINEDEEEL